MSSSPNQDHKGEIRNNPAESRAKTTCMTLCGFLWTLPPKVLVPEHEEINEHSIIKTSLQENKCREKNDWMGQEREKQVLKDSETCFCGYALRTRERLIA